MTDLDLALAAIQANPLDEGLRLGFYARLVDSELVLLLDREAQADAFSPRVFPLEEGPVALAFDGEERLAALAGAGADYAALPGRVLAAGLAGQGLGLGLNLGCDAPSIILPPEALVWLVDRLSVTPEPALERPARFAPPELPAGVLDALGRRLAPAGGAAMGALLVKAGYAGGREGHLIVFAQAAPEIEAALARAVGEAALFSGVADLTLDAAFLAAEDPARPVLAQVAVAFQVEPDMPVAAVAAPTGPGMDPARPPRLVR